MKVPIGSLSNGTASLADRGLELVPFGKFLDKFKEILQNPYDPDTNPDGFINMGVAENVCVRSYAMSLC